MKKKHAEGGRTARDAAAEGLARALDLPANAFTSMPHIELIGNSEALIEGCRGLLGYDESEIRVSAGKMVIRIAGSGLEIKSMAEGALVVAGRIASLAFTS